MAIRKRPDLSVIEPPLMPYKATATRRHKFAKAKYRVTNWPEYDAALVRRGSLTVWVTDEAIAAWHAPEAVRKRGGQRVYSDVAIETGLALRLVFRLGLRQTEGALGSIADLLGVAIRIPDHTTFSRRADGLTILTNPIGRGEPLHLLIDSTGLKMYGEGEWLNEKHGGRSRRRWRKLHLAVDARTQEVAAVELTPDDVGDITALPDLLDQVEEPVNSVTADGAYDAAPVYDAILNRHPEAEVIIPPRSTAVMSGTGTSQRDGHLETIGQHGRMGWQRRSGYGQRSLVEAAMYRYKSLIGRRLHARTLSNQKTEAKIGCSVINRMTRLGMPISVRVR
jgi:transposase